MQANRPKPKPFIPTSVAFNEREVVMVKEEAERERRPVSNLIRSIVIPELERRRAERQAA
jgi:hypothetical protein